MYEFTPVEIEVLADYMNQDGTSGKAWKARHLMILLTSGDTGLLIKAIVDGSRHPVDITDHMHEVLRLVAIQIASVYWTTGQEIANKAKQALID